MENVRILRPDTSPVGKGAKRGWLAVLVIAVAVVIGFSVMRLWVDLLWFAELDQREVLVTRLQWSSLMGLGWGLVAVVMLQANFMIARRVARNDLFVPFLQNANPEAPDQPTVPHYVMRPILLGLAVLGGLATGLVMASTWETVLRFNGRSSFGVKDPQFGHDAAFYVFTVPMIELVIHALQALIMLTIFAVGIAYVAMGVIRYTPVPRMARGGAVHIAILGACFFVLQAIAYRVDIWNLVLSTQGAATGAGYTDVHARMPGFWLMALGSLVLAGLFVWFARKGKWRMVGYSFVGWVALSIVVTSLLPSAVQKVSVEPNELKRETKVLKGNIAMTRLGYGLNDVERRTFNDDANLSSKALEANRDTTDNIRLWSPDVLRDVLAQKQELRSYYEFNDVDVDRYKIDGDYRQVMIAARELNPELLGTQTWVNLRMQYTHGYGVVGAWPNLSTSQGQPELFLSDIPPVPKGQKDIVVTRPEIYFGEEADNPVVVNTREKEFDYPDGDSNKFTQYAGDGGIKVSGFGRKLALAATFGDPRLLLTGSISPKSRYMYRRNINTRITTLAPFLSLDRDPYIVVLDGKLLWVQDAYTTSDRFPYSDFQQISNFTQVNYIRNSVKAVVDAYSGKVTLYASDPDDPLLKAWRKIFPSLFADLDEMPKGLEAHLRYPEDLFEMQTSKWLKYHMGDTRTFYQQEDLWELPEVSGEPLHAFYVLAKLPGGKAEELLLVRPMVPRNKKNLIAYMAARMDPGHYGEVISFTLPKSTQTQGPQQVSALIKQDTEISNQFRLWQSTDNTVVLGNLLVLPVEHSLLYIQPIYLESEEAKLPEFKKVVVVLGDTIAWGDTFDDAIAELYRKRGEAPAEPSTDGGTDGAGAEDGDGAGSGDTPTTGDGGTSLSEAELRTTLAEVGDHYEAAQKCQRAGDWACYGRELAEVQALLEKSGVAAGAASK